MNVHSEQLWNFLLTAARSGKILAMLLGPPCETWSSARFEQQLDENGRPIRRPRPLRGTTGMLGSTWPDAAGTSQLSVGNCLLLREFWLCIPVALCGGSVILEHPALPLQKERPWQTIMFCLGAAHCANGSMVTLGLGVKPTNLLYANNQTPHSLDQFAMPQLPRPEGALIGRASDKNGHFRTAQAKEHIP